ncbi:hypothetical protein VNO77_43747 [Canavalia gladiata]|uniref:Uncharacterized protein n=1 Tax=Canavalia gladiata TaxID=3824 RepID=A0AAN9JUP0_CANGL
MQSVAKGGNREDDGRSCKVGTNEVKRQKLWLFACDVMLHETLFLLVIQQQPRDHPLISLELTSIDEFDDSSSLPETKCS